MLATIAWSYELLTPPERTLLCEISIFLGSFSLCAAEAVCTDRLHDDSSVRTTLIALTEKSLVNAESIAGQTRYSILTSVQSFGMERLRASGEYQNVARRHAVWLATLAEGLNIDHIPDEEAGELLVEMDNIRSALDWSLNESSTEDRFLGGQIVAGFFPLWNALGRAKEQGHWIQTALERIDEQRHPLVAAKLLRLSILRMQFDPEVLNVAKRAMRVVEASGEVSEQARLHALIATIYATHERFSEADRSLEMALKIHRGQASENSPLYMVFLNNRAFVRLCQKRFTEARRDVTAAEVKALGLGIREYAITDCNFRRAQIEYLAGNLESALRYAEQIRDSEFGDRPDQFQTTRNLIAAIRLLLGDVEGAIQPLREVLGRLREDESIATHQELEYASLALAMRGKNAAAATVFGCVKALTKKSEPRRVRQRKDAFDRLCSLLRASLNERELVDAMDRGALLTPELAAAEALAALDSEDSS